MQIPVNKDLDDYHEDFFKGMTLRQTAMAALTLAAGIGSFLLFYAVFHIPQTIALYLVFPAALPFALLGFLKIDGRTLPDYLRKRRETVSSPFYPYRPVAFSIEEEEEKEPSGQNQKLRTEG